MSPEYLNVSTLEKTSWPPTAPPQPPPKLEVPSGDFLLTTREAAVILKVSVEGLKKWRQRGIGPAFIKYPNGAIRYRLSDVLQYVSDCMVGR